MKLLFDQNLSFRLVGQLEDLFPDSSQVRTLGLDTAADLEIWEFARDEGFTIVTKDSDFHELSLLKGPPPKVIWLKCGNVPTSTVVEILLEHRDAVRAFLADDDVAYIEIY